MINRFRFLFNKYTSDELTGTQLSVLRLLNEKGPSNTSFLAESLGVTLSAITAMINRLCKFEMVFRERRAEDRRQVWISITPKGSRILREVEQRRYFLLGIFFSKFSQKDRESILKVLQDVDLLFAREDILEEEENL